MNEGRSSPIGQNNRGGLLALLLVLIGALAVLCHQGFLPHRVMWANDVSLGAMLDPSNQLPGIFTGHWGTLEWIGGSGPSSPLTVTTLLQTILPATIYMKIYAPVTMLLLGFGAGLFFRQLGFAPSVCVIGGLGAGMNMHFFSNACWGLGNWGVSAAGVFVALAVLVSPSIRPIWVKAALGGICVGLVVMEGYDVGAILSLYVGLFLVFYFLRIAPNPFQGIPKTIGIGTVVVFFSLFIACSTLYTLVGTQIKGTALDAQTPEKRQEHWAFLTQWSFPKLETARLVIPGLFGYRLQDYITDTNKASAYWGRIGEDLHIDDLESSNPETRSNAAVSLGIQKEVVTVLTGDNKAEREQIVDQIKGYMQRRHTGSGDYTGVLVCLLAVFGFFNSLRKPSGPYTETERQSVWFWGAAAVFSLLAAWGRYAFLYQFIARLPFMGNIRNAIKFLHPLNVCLIVLSGYGLEALYRTYRASVNKRVRGIRAWWGSAAGFDKKWIIGTLLAFIAFFVGALIYSSSKADLIQHLTHNGFGEDMAPQMAEFSINEVFYFLGFFAASGLVIALLLGGAFGGGRISWMWILLGLIMFVDLERADAPWVRYYDYQQKLSPNPVVDFLKHDPWEHRVMSRFEPRGAYIPSDGNLPGLCHWLLENDYLANNIESLEIDQAPRLPDLDSTFIGNFAGMSSTDLSGPVRLWRLTNTRYILADARVTPALNQLAEPKNSFRNIMLMDIAYKPGIEVPEDAGDLTLKPNPNGSIALIEFTAALPRTKLYANWQTLDDSATLATLNTAQFDPTKTVLIATNTPLPEKPTQPDADPGTVKITDYQPRDVTLQADAKIPCVLLLNDRTGEFWKVWVDGKPAPILRCNYIMRGVFLPSAGQHTIEFKFLAPLQWLYVSIAAYVIGLGLVGYVVVSRFKDSDKD